MRLTVSESVVIDTLAKLKEDHMEKKPQSTLIQGVTGLCLGAQLLGTRLALGTRSDLSKRKTAIASEIPRACLHLPVSATHSVH